MKLSAAKKLGGMLGRATGVGSGGVDKTESKVGVQVDSGRRELAAIAVIGHW